MENKITVRFIRSKGEWGFSTSGKGRFVARLCSVLPKYGVEPVYTTDGRCDIDFHVSRFHYESKNCVKRVLRLGPVHVDTNKSWKWLNEKKKHALRHSHGVIYQSQFSKKMCDAFIGKSPFHKAVILNGAVPWVGAPAKSPSSINFLASARRWINQKRLDDIVKAFEVANVEGAILWVAGDTIDHKKSDNVFVRYLGLLDDEKLFAMHRLCNAMIHIVWIDACPNGVAEALVNGCPVIASDQGGTRELGVQALITDKPWNFKAADLDKVPRINIDGLAKAIRDFSAGRVSINADHLHIDNIARQYADFFKKVLNG